MKYLPNSVSRKAARLVLKTQKNSPQILLVAGIVGAVGSTVLACRATLKVDDEVLTPAENKLGAARVKHTEQRVQYTDKDYNRDVHRIYVDSAWKLTKLYAPAVIVGGLSIFALTKSHGIMSRRNASLAAAYAAIDKAFSEYRARVVADVGEDKDREYRYGGEEREIVSFDEKGNAKIEPRMRTSSDISGYAAFFDQTNANWEPNHQRNMAFISAVEQWANSRLIAKGHIFLNEVRKELGLPNVSEGATTGWLYESGDGDGFVDFQIFDRKGKEYRDFFNGPDGAILIDFNVDGEIYRMI